MGPIRLISRIGPITRWIGVRMSQESTHGHHPD